MSKHIRWLVFVVAAAALTRTGRIACLGVCLAIASSLLAPVSTSAADSAVQATLRCGPDTYQVLIHGQASVLDLVGRSSNYVVTHSLRIETGEVVVNSRGGQNKTLVECKLTSPELENSYLLTGFFTPGR